MLGATTATRPGRLLVHARRSSSSSSRGFLNERYWPVWRDSLMSVFRTVAIKPSHRRLGRVRETRDRPLRCPRGEHVSTTRFTLAGARRRFSRQAALCAHYTHCATRCKQPDRPAVRSILNSNYSPEPRCVQNARNAPRTIPLN